MINSKRIYIANLLISIIPNTCFQSFKIKLWKWAGVEIGRNVEIFQGAKIHGNGNLIIGDNVFIGHDVTILVNEDSSIKLCNYCALSTRVLIATGFHPITLYGERIIGREGTASDIIINSGAAILMDAKILPGVNIGKMALVAAGAVVNKDVDEYTLVAGVPIKKIKDLRLEDKKN